MLHARFQALIISRHALGTFIDRKQIIQGLVSDEDHTTLCLSLLSCVRI